MFYFLLFCSDLLAHIYFLHNLLTVLTVRIAIRFAALMLKNVLTVGQIKDFLIFSNDVKEVRRRKPLKYNRGESEQEQTGGVFW